MQPDIHDYDVEDRPTEGFSVGDDDAAEWALRKIYVASEPTLTNCSKSWRTFFRGVLSSYAAAAKLTKVQGPDHASAVLWTFLDSHIRTSQ